MALLVTKSNGAEAVFHAGDVQKCYGSITFTGAGDTYATGGVQAAREIRRVFGVRTILAVVFFGPLSDTAVTTGSAEARYDAATGKVKLYVIGRVPGAPGTPQQSEVEVANATSIDDGRLDFVAYCTGSGTTLGTLD